MRALQLEAVEKLAVADVPDPIPEAGEALVEIKAAALNHRDVWIKSGQYAGLKFPCIPGSDGAGVVAAVGSPADGAWIKRAVMINPSLGWGPDERAQSATSFNILGLPRPGTLAERVCVPVTQLAARPDFLAWDEAAAWPLAGLTAWRALFVRARLEPGERLLISGIGGGVALAALQFAVAAGVETWVTSGSVEKISRAMSLGAKGGFNYREADWTKTAAERGPFQVILEGAGGGGFDSLLDLAAPGARVVVYGATQGNPPGLALRKVFWRQISLLGSTMGSPADWNAMMAFIAKHRLKPIVSDVFPLSDAAKAFALMERGGQFGKIVVRIAE